MLVEEVAIIFIEPYIANTLQLPYNFNIENNYKKYLEEGTHRFNIRHVYNKAHNYTK